MDSSPIKVLLTRTGRLLLRTTIICALLCLIVANLDLLQGHIWNLKLAALRSGFPLLVLVGQVVKLVPMHFRKWKTIFELLWLFAQVAIFIYITKISSFFFNAAEFANARPVYYVSFFALFILTLASLFLVCLDLLINRGKNAWKPYTCLRSDSEPGWSILVGNQAFKRRFSSDNQFIRGVRGVSALALSFIIMLLALYLAIITPSAVRYNGVEVQTFTDIRDLSFIIPSIRFDSFYVVFDQGSPFTNITAFAVERSLTVQLVRWQSPFRRDTTTLDCTFDPTQGFPTALCPMDSLFLDVNKVLNEPGGFNSSVFPSLDISFDFSTALAASNLSPAQWPPQFPLQVYIGFADSARIIWENTPPVLVLPGSRLNVFGELSFMEKLANRPLATVGVPWKTTAFAFVKAISPLPSSQAPTNNNNTVGSFEVNFGIHLMGKIDRENDGRSTLDGLAALGGIWTLLNGVFAVIFGSSLVLVLFGRKPVSIYGLVHTVHGGKLYIEPSEKISSEQRDELVNLLHKHLIDTGDHNFGKATLTPGQVAGTHQGSSWDVRQT